MEALEIHTGSPTVHWENNTRFISIVTFKIVAPIFKHIDIPVCFIQEQYDNDIFITEYEKSVIMPSYMCNKTY